MNIVLDPDLAVFKPDPDLAVLKPYPDLEIKPDRLLSLALADSRLVLNLWWFCVLVPSLLSLTVSRSCLLGRLSLLDFLSSRRRGDTTLYLFFLTVLSPCPCPGHAPCPVPPSCPCPWTFGSLAIPIPVLVTWTMSSETLSSGLVHDPGHSLCSGHLGVFCTGQIR